MHQHNINEKTIDTNRLKWCYFIFHFYKAKSRKNPTWKNHIGIQFTTCEILKQMQQKTEESRKGIISFTIQSSTTDYLFHFSYIHHSCSHSIHKMNVRRLVQNLFQVWLKICKNYIKIHTERAIQWPVHDNIGLYRCKTSTSMAIQYFII